MKPVRFRVDLFLRITAAELFQEEYGPVFHISNPGLYEVGVIGMWQQTDPWKQ